MNGQEVSDTQDRVFFNLKYLPKTSTIQRNLHCCQKCHFIQPNRYASKEGRDEKCPNCGDSDINKISYNSPIITIIDAEKSFLGRIIMSKTGLKELIPGMYSLYVVFEQNDEKDE